MPLKTPFLSAFKISHAFSILDFSLFCQFVSEILCDATNFNIKKFKFFQIWHVSQNQPELIKNFAERHWRANKAEGKLIINKKSNTTYNHISDANSLWK